ncbi:MAG: hypothetical protein R2851_27035 [Caldilineaceae bacterium]
MNLDYLWRLLAGSAAERGLAADRGLVRWPTPWRSRRRRGRCHTGAALVARCACLRPSGDLRLENTRWSVRAAVLLDWELLWAIRQDPPRFLELHRQELTANRRSGSIHIGVDQPGLEARIDDIAVSCAGP